jgi:hypothetical protein
VLLGVAAMPVLALTALGGCSLTGVTASDTVQRTLPVADGTALRVETFNGPIQVTVAGPGEELVIDASVRRTGEGRDRPAAEADRDRIDVTLRLVDGIAVLEAVYTPSPDAIRGARGAAVTITVPRGTVLDRGPRTGVSMSMAPADASRLGPPTAAWR